MMDTFLAVLMVLAIYVGISAVIGFAVAGGIILPGWVNLRSGKLVCVIDADCPPGYVCIDGRCMPNRAS